MAPLLPPLRAARVTSGPGSGDRDGACAARRVGHGRPTDTRCAHPAIRRSRRSRAAVAHRGRAATACASPPRETDVVRYRQATWAAAGDRRGIEEALRTD